MADKYASFEALLSAERKDVDYRTRIVRRETAMAIIAPPYTAWPEDAGYAATVVTSGRLAARSALNIL